MATYDFPADVCITEVSLTEGNAVGNATSPYTFAREVQDWGGEQWRMVLNFLPMSRGDAAQLEAFISRLRGGVNSFRQGDPYRSLPRGNDFKHGVSPNRSVKTAVAQATTIEVQGFLPNTSDQLLANDLIEIEGYLYKVLVDADSGAGGTGSDGSGSMTLEVWPRLRKAHAADTEVITRNPRGTFTLADSNPTFNRTRFERFENQIQCVEVL
jgi:hypothetical protein